MPPPSRDTGKDETVISETELSECHCEQLHLIGNIQADSGHVVYMSYPEGEIIAADKNACSIEWIKSRTNETTLIGSSVEAWIPFDLYTDLFKSILDMIKAFSYQAFMSYKHNGVSYTISVSSTDHDYKTIGFEIEDVDEEETAYNCFNTVTNLGRGMELYTNEVMIVKTACDAVFHLLGKYERGVVFRFNDDLSGEAIHEIKAPSITSSNEGVRYPLSGDLSARKLYMTNGLLRYIHNVDDDPVPIICQQDKHSIDLSHCRMRAAATAHVVYLKNMGATCSLSLSIVVENELWGLLTFHGYTAPFKPSLHQRIACETISSMVSVRIEAIIKKAQQSNRVIALGNCMLNLKQEQSAIHNLLDWGDGLLGVFDADIIVGHLQDPRGEEGDIIVLGDRSLLPTEIFWSKMSTKPNRELVAIATREEMDEVGLSTQDCPACGFVYFHEGRTQIMIARKERSRDVMWAGNPDEPKLKRVADRFMMRPRFMEKAHKESRAWNTQDIHVITVFRDRICEHSHNWMMRLMQNDIEDTNRKYLSAIDRARDNYEFFAHMSHELRTPFHGVMGCLNILHDSMDEMSKEETMDILNTAISSGNHMLNLLNDILDLSKNKQLSHEVGRDKVVFQTLAFEAIDGMKSLAQSRSISLKSQIFPNDRRDVIITDRTKIIQIVSNTVNNAIKFTDQRGIEARFDLVDTAQDAVRLFVDDTKHYTGMVFIMKQREMLRDHDSVVKEMARSPNSPNMRWIYFSVRDCGCGMKPSEISEMFSPYTQSSSESNRAFQGTGLGLYICLSLAQQMSGFIACGSTEGTGTTFCVGIPVEFCQTNDSTSPPSRAQTPSPIPADEKDIITMNGPLMIVDDNNVNVKILKRALEMQFKTLKVEFPIITAGGGREAIELYTEHRPSLLIIDYHMPEVDGLEVTRAVREYEQSEGLTRGVIVCYTADATEKAQNTIFAAGIDEIMSKPPPKGLLEGLALRLRHP